MSKLFGGPIVTSRTVYAEDMTRLETGAQTLDATDPVLLDTTDRSRYERMLDHELDRQLMSEVEREDHDLLTRVRDALYADD